MDRGPRTTGDAFENFSRIAVGWNAIIKEAMGSHGHVTERHVALMMDWLKTARLLNDLDKADSWIPGLASGSNDHEYYVAPDFSRD